MQVMIGVIGGSGIYEIDGLEGASWLRVDTPWGEASDKILTGRLDGVPIAFLPRHGRGHLHAPSSVNYRANIDALKRIGVHRCRRRLGLRVLARGYGAGRFRPCRPVHRPHRSAREKLFRIGLRGPCQSRPSDLRAAGASLRDGGRRLGRDGAPRRHLSRDGGAAVFQPRRKPALSQLGLRRDRHDRACPRPSSPARPSCAMPASPWSPTTTAGTRVTAPSMWPAFLRRSTANAGHGRSLVAGLPAAIGPERAPCPQGCDHALDHAIMTAPDKRDPALLARLDAVAGRVLG